MDDDKQPAAIAAGDNSPSAHVDSGEVQASPGGTSSADKTPHLKLVQPDVAPPKATNWRGKLLKTGKTSPPLKVLANAIVPLRHAPEWKGALSYNENALTVVLNRAPPWEEGKKDWQPRVWADQDDRLFAEWLQRQSVFVGTNVASEAVVTVAHEHSFHPIREYLTALKWDGCARIESWLATYLGVEDNAYVAAVGKRWLISGIARVMTPGPDCKADCVLVLQGDQGLGKSTALQILAGQWFTDEARRFGTKDSAMQLAGRWIVEIAELAVMNDITIEALKAFLSQSMDRFRPPFGRHVTDNPRQNIFAATTNKDAFLKDETGDRRFWPVLCTKVDVEGLKRDRDQLWAEAFHYWKQGHTWWLETPELRQLAEEEQERRFDIDPWESEIYQSLKGSKDTTPERILTEVFDYEVKDITKRMRIRVSNILRHMRWERVRIKTKDQRDSYLWVPPGLSGKVEESKRKQ